MTDIAIRVENLSKQYRIGGPQGRFAYRSLRESLTGAVQAPFRRAAKLLRGQATGAAELDETIWALKDVSFEACPELSRRVQRGEVGGIPSLRQAQHKRQPFGGAQDKAQDKHWPQRGGEDHAYFDRLSTGLKVLSRITEPTEGALRSWRAETHGRVGSLLEAVS